MNFIHRTACLFLAVVFSSSVFAAVLNTKAQQYAALDAVISELEVHYGMERFKRDEFAITLPGLRKKYRRLIRTATTLEEEAGLAEKKERKILSPRQLQLLLVGLAAELRDGHTNISTKSMNIATLGIHAAAIDGKLYVTGFSENFYNGAAVTQEVKIGDEIISINNRPVLEVAERNMLYVQDGTFAARQQAALEMTISVPYAILPEVNEGDLVTLKFQRGKKEFKGRFNWIEAEDFFQLRSMFPNEFPNPAQGAEFDTGEFVFGRSGFVRSYFREGLSQLPPGSISDVGMQFNAELEEAAKKPARREGEQIIKPTKRIPAYIVHYKGKNIGVIRIPSYSPGEIMNEYLWVLNVLNRMNYSTDMLIIDQLGNSGGAVLLVMKWMGLFANGRPLTTVATDTKISETLIEMNSQFLSMGGGRDRRGPHRYTDRRMSERELKRLKELYEAGEVWTGLRPDWGSTSGNETGVVGEIFPDEYATYNKPILLLNDSRSASGGDFFPAMMQQNGRALIMGETSKGLGGPVYRQTESLPGSEVSMRCTSGYCERPGGIPIENKGAIPDIYRGMNQFDLIEGFTTYSFTVLEAALQVLQGTDVEKIQALVQQMVPVQQQSHGVMPEIPEKVGEGFTFMSMAILDADTKHPDRKAQIERSIEIYQKVAPVIESQIPEEGLSRVSWEQLTFPLPSVLTEADIILQGLWRKGEVLERLNDMLKLRKYKHLHPLIKVILTESSRFEGNIRFADPCERLLTNP